TFESLLLKDSFPLALEIMFSIFFMLIGFQIECFLIVEIGDGKDHEKNQRHARVVGAITHRDVREECGNESDRKPEISKLLYREWNGRDDQRQCSHYFGRSQLYPQITGEPE